VAERTVGDPLDGAVDDREERDRDRERDEDAADDCCAAESAVSPRTEKMTVLATRPDSANTSPWAKLISCRMP